MLVESSPVTGAGPVPSVVGAGLKVPLVTGEWVRAITPPMSPPRFFQPSGYTQANEESLAL